MNDVRNKPVPVQQEGRAAAMSELRIRAVNAIDEVSAAGVGRVRQPGVGIRVTIITISQYRCRRRLKPMNRPRRQPVA